MGSLQLHLADLVCPATWDKSGGYIHVYYSGKSSQHIHEDIWDISGINRHTPDFHQFPRFPPDIHVDIWGCACWDVSFKISYINVVVGRMRWSTSQETKLMKEFKHWINLDAPSRKLPGSIMFFFASLYYPI